MVEDLRSIVFQVKNNVMRAQHSIKTHVLASRKHNALLDAHWDKTTHSNSVAASKQTRITQSSTMDWALTAFLTLMTTSESNAFLVQMSAENFKFSMKNHVLASH